MKVIRDEKIISLNSRKELREGDIIDEGDGYFQPVQKCIKDPSVLCTVQGGYRVCQKCGAVVERYIYYCTDIEGDTTHLVACPGGWRGKNENTTRYPHYPHCPHFEGD